MRIKGNLKTPNDQYLSCLLVIDRIITLLCPPVDTDEHNRELLKLKLYFYIIQTEFGRLPPHNRTTPSSSSSSSPDRYLQAHLHTDSKLYTGSRKAELHNRPEFIQ